ncbi:MAG TPA: hypothetical protein VKK31_28920 [Thermoanaerobaculia bacterium]|nr:hypothetical protein [Thermoanaerobaculia bacterium]
MSVLSFPRIYFQGFVEWNPNTTNNNDYVPAYDIADAVLDWDFLGQQSPPVTQQNFRETFKPWVIKPLADTCPDPNGGPSDSCNNNPTVHMPSRWNYYGDNGCSFVQYQQNVTLTVGGDLAYGQPAATSDPILQKPVSLIGNTFGGRSSPARLIDINPASPFCSQIYLASLQAGDAQTFVGGPPAQRMFSRSFFVPRNISSDLIIAGAIGVIFQTTVPLESIQSGNGGSSPLLSALLEAMQAQGAAGLMLRFATYNTVYYQNGIYNDTPEQPRTCNEIYQLYQQGKVFSNPAYSRTTGTLGLWNQGELATAPGGHMLIPNATVTPVPSVAATAAAPKLRALAGAVKLSGHAEVGSRTAAVSAPPPLAFGVLWAEVNEACSIVSLDLGNAIPEYTVDGQKFDYGTITVGVQMPDGSFNPIGSFGFDQYENSAYEAHGGIVDVPFAYGVTGQDVSQWLSSGNLALQVGTTIASLEQPFMAETDNRGVYVDECRTQQITVQVSYRNGAPPDGTRLRIAQYYPYPLLLGSGMWVLFGTPPPSGGAGAACNATPPAPFLTFPEGDDVAVDANGTATFTIAAAAPGCPIVAFYPYTGTPPSIPAQVNFGFTSYATPSIGTASYAAVRVLPFDNALVPQFVDCWNATGTYAGQPKYDATRLWQFLYGNVLYSYDMLYPVMDQFMPLGNRIRVEGAANQLLMMVSESMEVASTLYMPVTRELSAGKRLILEAWCNLVIRKYPQEDLPTIVVPCNVRG